MPTGLPRQRVLAKALQRISRPAEVRILGRGENPWSPEWREGLGFEPGGLIVADLGVRSEPVLPGVPTVLIDHHVPRGMPAGATVISGYGHEPTPTSGMLAFWCAQRLADVDDLLWIAAISLIGDMAEDAGFAEMAEARKRYGATALREATSLLNAARRSGSWRRTAGFDLLMKAAGPKEVVSGVPRRNRGAEGGREEVQGGAGGGQRVSRRRSGARSR
jgi:single-stranded-DNA-specific exonuclease